MAEVFATMFQDEALVVKSLIESTGIQAEISSEHILEIYPIFFPQGGGIKIIVADEDAEDALAVVAQFREPKGYRKARLALPEAPSARPAAPRALRAPIRRARRRAWAG